MKKDFQKDLQDSRIPRFPPAAVQKIEKSIKMVKIIVENFSEEELRKRWNELARKENGITNVNCVKCQKYCIKEYVLGKEK